MKKEDIIKLRDYFKEHDKTPFEHWAYTFLNNQLATDGREELEKENERLKADYEVLNETCAGFQKSNFEWFEKCTALQSSLKEKEQLLEERDATIINLHELKSYYKNQITGFENKLTEKEKECEKWREAFNATHTELQDERKFSKEMLLRENEYVEQTKKQIEELKAEDERLKGLASAPSNDYWKKRCEAAEEVIKDQPFTPNADMYWNYQSSLERWQALQSTPIPILTPNSEDENNNLRIQLDWQRGEIERLKGLCEASDKVIAHYEESEGLFITKCERLEKEVERLTKENKDTIEQLKKFSENNFQ